jgi:cytochrome b6-f complex iron-sulfur subunit
MASQDSTEPQQTEKGFNRRTFFTRLGFGSLSIAAAGTLSFAYQFLSPNVLFEGSPIINAGKPESYPIDSVTLDANSRIYLIHVQEGLFSLNAVCTHLGCLTAWKPDLGLIACPCHGSKFSREGQKLEGPAPKPLSWLKTWLSEDGDIMVDRSTTVPALQFLRI